MQNDTTTNDLAVKKLTYIVIDTHTLAIVAKATTRKGATRIADRKDLAYGSVRYVVRCLPN